MKSCLRFPSASLRALLIVCSGLALLAWIGMPEQESGIATVHWIGPQGHNENRCDGSGQNPASPQHTAPLSLFNDAAGRPDPNGIMWIDPMELVRRFPEKYAGCIVGDHSGK